MSQQSGDLEQWQIQEQNPDESWSSFAQSTTRTPRKLIIIALIILVLGASAFGVGLFLAGRSSTEVQNPTATPTPATSDTQDVNTLLNEIARQLAATPTEPYLAVQIFNSDIGVLGRVATTEEREQIVTLLETTFSSELDSDAIAIDPDLDEITWVNEIRNSVEVFSNEPVLSHGFGINNAELILNAALPQTTSQTTLVDAFSELTVELVDESIVDLRDQIAEIRISSIDGALEIDGTVPSEGVANQIAESASRVHEGAIDVSIDISGSAFASLQFGQIDAELTLAGLFETYNLLLDDQTKILTIPTLQSFDNENRALTENLQTLLLLLASESDFGEYAITIEVHNDEQAPEETTSQSNLITSYIAANASTINIESITSQGNSQPANPSLSLIHI